MSAFSGMVIVLFKPTVKHFFQTNESFLIITEV